MRRWRSFLGSGPEDLLKRESGQNPEQYPLLCVLTGIRNPYGKPLSHDGKAYGRDESEDLPSDVFNKCRGITALSSFPASV